MRRLISTGVLSIVLAGLLPLTSQAATGAVVNVTGATTYFDPTRGQVASVEYTVSGTETAKGLIVKIYQPTSLQPGCYDDGSAWEKLVATIDGPQNRAVGKYTPTWKGTKDGETAAQPEGTYCYSLRWDNPQYGSLGKKEGYISISTPGSGYYAATGSLVGIPPVDYTRSPMTVSVSPSVIDPNSTDTTKKFANISYTVKQELATGFSLSIYDTNGNFVKSLYATGLKLTFGTQGVVQWDGRHTDGNVVANGYYQYKFTIAGFSPVIGYIQVSSTSNNVPVADIEHYVSPSYFNPNAASPANVTTIYYTVKKRLISGLGIEIRDVNDNTVRQLFSTTLPIEIGSYSVMWKGKYNNGNIVPAGLYKYVLISDSRVIGYNLINVAYTVDNPPPPPPVTQFIVGAPTATPSTFVPGNSETTTIAYTLGKGVYNFKLTVKNSGNTFSTVLTSATYKTAGNYANIWDGQFNGALAPAGTYNFILEATGENAVMGMVSVAASNPQNLPVITDLGPNPAAFAYAGGSTSFRYQLNQDARVDLIVLNSANATIRRALVSTFANNGYANTTNVVNWDGLDENGFYVLPGNYTYVIEARNSNGTAASKTGNIVICSSSAYSCGDPGTALDVSNAFADPASFNPLNQNTLLKFTLNQAAQITVTVTRTGDNSFIKTVASNSYMEAGNRSVSWDGRDQYGSVVAYGSYNFRVDAVSSQYGKSDSIISTVTVAPTQTGSLDVSNPYAEPATFNPERQGVMLHFYLNQSARATITVTRANDGVYVKTVATDQYFDSGDRSASWSGNDQYGNVVSNGIYNFRVDATSSLYGSDAVTGSVTADRSLTSSSVDVYSVYAYPADFDPTLRSTYLTFSLSQSGYVTIVVTNSNGYRIKSLTSNQWYGAGSALTALWDGRDDNGNIVPAGTYNFRVDVTSSGSQYGSDYATGTVKVIDEEYDPLPPINNCGNFSDISKNNSLCPAIQFVKSKGIFAGYSDGTIGLDKVIKRAELLAVVQKAFKYPLDSYDAYTDRGLGFKDLTDKTSAWYMPYIKTFKRLGLITGYPDRTMHPERTMSTAELYLVFLKAAKASPRGIANFVLEDKVPYAPFIDTPMKKNSWYLKYAFFALSNGLVVTEKFYPARGITRGQVIQLVYDTYRKGLITY
ncbi:S-layer homology domain-containing protein [Candidatus Peregrinibacteria bacterium]|nr:S-layer homology domain-containing protein [Candidatus Peregrinibacteria bacterium]